MKSRSRSLFAVFIVFFLDNFGFAMAFPIMSPILLDPSFKFFSPETTITIKNIYLGIMLAAFPLGQFIGAPVIGDMADHFGRKRLFVITIISTAAGFILCGFAVLCENYFFLLIARFLSGIVAGNLSLCLAAIVDLSETEKMKRVNFSLLTTIGGLGWIVSIVVSGLLANPSVSSYFFSFASFLGVRVFITRFRFVCFEMV